MDSIGSEKDAARSKWRLSQKHKPGGRGHAGAARGGRRQSATRDLESNVDRYLEPAEPEGQAPRSQGADLAELLSAAEALDVGYYYRLRTASQLVEPALPAGEPAYQGLSLDLGALAAVLATLPLREVLDSDLAPEEQPSGGEQAGPPEDESLDQEQEQEEAGPLQIDEPVAQPAAAAQRAAAALPAVAQQSLEGGASGSGRGAGPAFRQETAGRLPGAQGAAEGMAAGTAAGAAAAGALPPPRVEHHEDELDQLLALPVAGHAGAGRTQQQAAVTDSLEDWLDSL